jgi:alpha-D-ribose 1-methylphosphonate 5-triphosphate synthase subunit PhnG
VRKQKTKKELNAIVDALYRERDSDKWLNLVNSLTPNERNEALRRVRERVEADKTQFSKLFEKTTGKKQSE